MFYMDYEPDFMQSFHRAFLAKNIVDNLARISEPVKVWTTHSPQIELDSKHKIILLEGNTIFSYDFLWIGNLARFLSIESEYKHSGPDRIIEGIKQYSWTGEGEHLDLFLYPWASFPIWPGMEGDIANNA